MAVLLLAKAVDFSIGGVERGDRENVKSAQAVQQLARGAVGKRGIHLIEPVLGTDELAAVSILQRFQQQARRQSCLAHTGRADQHEVLLATRPRKSMFSVPSFCVLPKSTSVDFTTIITAIRSFSD